MSSPSEPGGETKVSRRRPRVQGRAGGGLSCPAGLGYNRGQVEPVEHSRSGFYLCLLAGAAVLGVSIFGFTGLFGRAEMPWYALAAETGLDEAELTRPGVAVRADGFPVRNIEFDFKFIAARHRIGDPVEFVFRVQGGREITVTEALVPYYADRGLPYVFFVTGLIGFLIGLGVFVLRREDPAARLFYWLCL